MTPILTYQVTPPDGDPFFVTIASDEGKSIVISTRDGDWGLEPYLTIADLIQPCQEYHEWDFEKIDFEMDGDDAFPEFEEHQHPRDPSGKFETKGTPAEKFKARFKSPDKPPHAPVPKPPAAQVFENVQSGMIGELIRHTAMRDYTPSEMDWEYEREYKVYSRPHFPKAFASREDYQQQYDAAPLIHLSLQELRGLGNSMAASGYNKGEAWVHQAFGHRRDTTRILDHMKNGLTAPPIILRRGNRLWLMAGQTRLGAGLALGRSIPAKVITVE